MMQLTLWIYFRPFNYTNRIFNDDGIKYKFDIDFYSTAVASARVFINLYYEHEFEIMKKLRNQFAEVLLPLFFMGVVPAALRLGCNCKLRLLYKSDIKP